MTETADLFLGVKHTLIFDPATGGYIPKVASVNSDLNSVQDITIADNGLLDAFGRIRVSEPHTLFESQLTITDSTLLWESTGSSGGSVTYVPNQAATRLRVDGTSGALAWRQSHRYIRYQPSKSQQVLCTFVMGSAATNVRRRVGYFDSRNGIFLEQTSSGPSLVRRSYVSGTAIDYSVSQASWNLDPLDGTGDSGITIDLSKAQILYIDLEWLGVGRVRAGFVIDGHLYLAHEFLNTNTLNTVYMQTANLPIRYEIQNTGAGSGSADLMAICSSVSSEGGRQDQNITFNYTMTTSRQVTNVPLPIMSIRVNPAFPSGGTGTTLNRETVKLESLEIYTEDAAIAWWVVYNGYITGSSFSAVNSQHSGVDVDVSATAIVGGLRIEGGYAVATTQSKSAIGQNIKNDLAIGLNAGGDVGDIISVVAQRLTSTSSDTWVSLTWSELF